MLWKAKCLMSHVLLLISYRASKLYLCQWGRSSASSCVTSGIVNNQVFPAGIHRASCLFTASFWEDTFHSYRLLYCSAKGLTVFHEIVWIFLCMVNLCLCLSEVFFKFLAFFSFMERLIHTIHILSESITKYADTQFKKGKVGSYSSTDTRSRFSFSSHPEEDEELWSTECG